MSFCFEVSELSSICLESARIEVDCDLQQLILITVVYGDVVFQSILWLMSYLANSKFSFRFTFRILNQSARCTVNLRKKIF